MPLVRIERFFSMRGSPCNNLHQNAPSRGGGV
jgi:hypothetical protein